MNNLPFKHLSLADIHAIIEQSKREKGEGPPSSDYIDELIARIPDPGEFSAAFWRTRDLPPREASPLYRMLMALSYEAMRELEALMWLGRGDDTDFATLLDNAHKFPDNQTAGAAYITGKACLHEYLECGLQKLTTHYGTAN